MLTYADVCVYTEVSAMETLKNLDAVKLLKDKAQRHLHMLQVRYT
jgi:hypothetical protein